MEGEECYREFFIIKVVLPERSNSRFCRNFCCSNIQIQPGRFVVGDGDVIHKAARIAEKIAFAFMNISHRQALCIEREGLKWDGPDLPFILLEE